jgi:hypothetical protein
MSAIGSLEGRSRAALTRSMRADNAREAEAQRAAGTLAEARLVLKRQDRVRLAVRRLQGFLDLLVDHLSEQRRDAAVHGELSRVDRIDRQIDELYREFDKLARGLAGDFG